MEQSTACWFSNLVAEDAIIDQWEMSSIDHLLTQNTLEDFQVYSSHPLFSTSNTINNVSNSPMESSLPLDRPRKTAKSNSWDSSCTEDIHPSSAMAPSGSSPTILSFGNPDSPSDLAQLYELDRKILNTRGVERSYETMVTHKEKKATGVATKPLSKHQEHVIAERKRRENLTRKFIALSAMMPGLKKMDKASVLGDAIKYLKQLEEQVKNLEDQATKRTARSAAVIMKGKPLHPDNFEDQSFVDSLPEVEVRLSGMSVLVKIHCENHKGVLVKALSEIDNLNITVTNTSVVPFAGSSLDVTVMAQIEEGFSIAAKDVEKNLKLALREFI